MINYIAQKKLRDGSFLTIYTWVSDTIRPGENMFQIGIYGNGAEMHYQSDFSKYSEAQIRNFYSIINSRDEFRRLVLGPAS